MSSWVGIFLKLQLSRWLICLRGGRFFIMKAVWLASKWEENVEGAYDCKVSCPGDIFSRVINRWVANVLGSNCPGDIYTGDHCQLKLSMWIYSIFQHTSSARRYLLKAWNKCNNSLRLEVKNVANIQYVYD